MREQPALERALAGPDHARGEVLVAVLAQPRLHLGVHLWPLARQHEQLLATAACSVVELALDLIRRVEVRLVGRERAVLAVAATGPGEGQRVVARERDSSHCDALIFPRRRSLLRSSCEGRP